MSDPIKTDSNRLFEALKTSRLVKSEVSKKNELFFQIFSDDNRYYLRTVNEKGAVDSFDYRGLNGVKRDLLKAIENSQIQSEMYIDWDRNDPTSLALDEHSHLIWLLNRCDNVVDQNMSPLHFKEGNYSLLLELTEEEQRMRGRFRLLSENGKDISLNQLNCLTQANVINENQVYNIAPVGESYASLSLFEDTFTKAQINECLTLLHSSFTNVQIRYLDYKIQRNESLTAEPALVFRQVDSHSALYMEILHYLPGLSLEFIRDYDITSIAFIDELEHLICISEVEYESQNSSRSSLIQILKKLSRKIDTDNSFWTEGDDGQLILGADLAESFLRDYLPDLTNKFRIFGSEKLKNYKIRHAQPKLHLNLSHGIDFLEGHAELELDGERFSLHEALQQYRKKNYIALSDGTQAVLNLDYVNKLTRLFKKNQKGVKVSFFDLPLIDDLIEENAKESVASVSRSIFEGFNQLKKRRLQLPSINGKLRSYQKDGVKWLEYLHSNLLGGCLADDMGLGKTLQVISLLSKIYPKEKKQTLIVMPKSLLFNWKNELEHFCPELTFDIYYGPNREIEKVGKSSLILTTYGTLRNDVELFSKIQFQAVILDESQAIKNIQTQTAQAALALKAKFRLAMSGTPIENNLGELYTLFRFLNPCMFNSMREFDRDYLTPIQRHGDKDAGNELRKKVYPFILRRLKGDVLKDLPPKVEQVLYVEMSDSQKQLYESRRQFYQKWIKGEIEQHGIAKSQFIILEAMMELRQIATVPEIRSEGEIPSSKREILSEVLSEAIANNRKCLVFSNFLGGIEQVSSLLKDLQVEHLTMTGATANRQELVERFQSDPRIKVFVMTLKTGGVGLNLTAADTVFILDPWWNTSAENQAVDRTHRIGQQSTVFTYRIIAKDTIEEKIRTLQLQKKELADQIISSDGTVLKSLSEADIDHLLEA